MNILESNKPYKACDPILTINKIRNILSECNIFLLEKHHTVADNFFSCRLILSGNNLEKLNKGTNGKGLTPAYSLASAYGEFMERMQNYYIINESLVYARKNFNFLQEVNDFKQKMLSENLFLDFEYDPDEKYLSSGDLNQIQKDIIETISISNESINFELNVLRTEERKFLFVPFYCVSEKKTEYLPLQLFLAKTGSNGMCAGNTKEEALIQGFCEIFERYVAKIIFQQELSPPTIPKDLFAGSEIFDLLTKLEDENNVSIHIKDCSLDLGLPVIGLLIIDHDSHSYTFNLGSDTSPVVALERCFTEMYQGDQYKQLLKKIDVIHDHFNNSICSRESVKNEELFKFIIKGDGRFPNSILYDNFSYSFKGLNYNLNKNDEEDLNYIINKIKELGHNIYIRDVSFLGFPSFYIYIPGMSEVISPFTDKIMENAYEKRRKFNKSSLYDIKRKSKEEYEIIAELLEKEKGENVVLFPYNVNENNVVNRCYLLALIYYRILNYRKSYENLILLINSFNEGINNTYLCCSRDFIYFKDKVELLT